MKHPNKRLGHRKSRNGCLQCKARHVKCDEQRPCSSCVRFEASCSLIDGHGQKEPTVIVQKPLPAAFTKQSKERVNNQASLLPIFSSVEEPNDHSAIYRNALSREDHRNTLSRNTDPFYHSQLSSPYIGGHDDEIDDDLPLHSVESMRLLHHYSTVVHATLTCCQPATQRLWRDVVPEAAFSCDFLMHSLLAVSAVHYAYSHPDERAKYSVLSTKYQSLAIQHFTSNLANLNDANFLSFFLSATFIFILTMCSITNPLKSAHPITLKDVAQSLLLQQGIKSIRGDQDLTSWPDDGPLGPLLRPVVMSNGIKPGPFHDRLEQLMGLARDLPVTFEAINVQSCCILAIESLRMIHHSVLSEGESHKPRVIWLWPMTLTKMYIGLIHDENPAALIILAHYAALTTPYEHTEWVNKGWGCNVLRLVENSLGEEWLEWVAWPRRLIHEGVDVDDVIIQSK